MSEVKIIRVKSDGLIVEPIKELLYFFDQSSFERACEDGQFEVVKLIMTECKDLYFDRSIIATSDKHPEICGYLIDNYPEEQMYGFSLIYEISNKNIDMMAKFFEKFSKEKQQKLAEEMFSHAVQKHKLAVLKYLKSKGYFCNKTHYGSGILEQCFPHEIPTKKEKIDKMLQTYSWLCENGATFDKDDIWSIDRFMVTPEIFRTIWLKLMEKASQEGKCRILESARHDTRKIFDKNQMDFAKVFLELGIVDMKDLAMDYLSHITSKNLEFLQLLKDTYSQFNKQVCEYQLFSGAMKAGDETFLKALEILQVDYQNEEIRSSLYNVVFQNGMVQTVQSIVEKCGWHECKEMLKWLASNKKHAVKILEWIDSKSWTLPRDEKNTFVIYIAIMDNLSMMKYCLKKKQITRKQIQDSYDELNNSAKGKAVVKSLSE